MTEQILFSATRGGILARLVIAGTELIPSGSRYDREEPMIEFFDSKVGKGLRTPFGAPTCEALPVARLLEHDPQKPLEVTPLVTLTADDVTKTIRWTLDRLDEVKPDWRATLPAQAWGQVDRWIANDLALRAEQMRVNELITFDQVCNYHDLSPGVLKVLQIQNCMVPEPIPGTILWGYNAEDFDRAAREYKLASILDSSYTIPDCQPMPAQTIMSRLKLTREDMDQLAAPPFRIGEVQSISSGLFSESQFPLQAVVAARIAQLQVSDAQAGIAHLASLVGASAQAAKYVQVSSAIRPVWNLQGRGVGYSASQFFDAWSRNLGRLPQGFAEREGISATVAMRQYRLSAHEFDNLAQRHSLEEGLCDDLTLHPDIVAAAVHADQIQRRTSSIGH